MKKIFIASIALFLLLLSSHAFGQKRQSYVPEKGYWQLVSNIKDKKTVTVKFFTDQNEMIYEETLSGNRMNPNKTKVRKQLYYALKDACNQWALNQKVSSNDLIVKRK